MFIISIKILKENSHKYYLPAHQVQQKWAGLCWWVFETPPPQPSPTHQGKSPIRCITTVLLIGWDLSVIMKDCIDACAICCEALCVCLLWYKHVIVLAFIYRCDDVRVLDILHQVKYANKNKTNIPWENQSMGNSNNCSSWDSFSLLCIICFCLAIFHLQSVFLPNCSRSLCVLDLSSVSCIDCFCNPQASVVRLRRPDLKAGGWWTLRKKVSVVSNFSFLHLFCHFFLLFPLSPL